ncbi:hypothetical protein NHF50_00285 [Flavobacterium sp. NRK F10]|uniref:DUF6705 family protein n=1 Tax=Flavobacterium sp. NRK F10 TaxID=2954931 RepID=UPI002091105F|nr:DUF6705 family protein [Flavobacterium sp. NRK F10]MCO6173473.1 hypothetical protein [Flavobacterium sp. NRK F10]
MKTIYTLLSLLIINLIYSQTIKPISSFYTESLPTTPIDQVYYKDVFNMYDPFVGTWYSQNGNQTFIVTIWKQTKYPSDNSSKPLYYMDNLFGHYKLVENYGSLNEEIIYTSETTYLNSSQLINTIINGDSIEFNKMTAIIYDINTRSDNFMYYFGKKGYLIFTIDANSSNSAHWEIENANEENMTGIPTPAFIIPTDIILTKQ